VVFCFSFASFYMCGFFVVNVLLFYVIVYFMYMLIIKHGSDVYNSKKMCDSFLLCFQIT